DVDSTGTAVYGNKIGTNGAGTAAVGSAQGIGIRVFGKSCTIGGTDATYRNLISGNSANGISLESNSATCVITANWIGTDGTGAAALANGGGIGLGGTSNRVGGPTAGERNVISGNTSEGIALYGVFDLIQGNYIGTNASGDAALGNGGLGIRAIAA